jgi:hypothetical protein
MATRRLNSSRRRLALRIKLNLPKGAGAFGSRRFFAFDWGLVQPVLDLVETGGGARFVFVTARSAGRGNATDRVVSDFDGHAALSRAEFFVVHAWIKSARRGDPLGEVSGRDPLQGGRVGLAAGDLRPHTARAVSDDDHLRRAGAIGDDH